MRHNIVKQLVESSVVSLDFVKSELNLANPLIKSLNKSLIEIMSTGMRLLSILEDKSDGNYSSMIRDPIN